MPIVYESRKIKPPVLAGLSGKRELLHAKDSQAENDRKAKAFFVPVEEIRKEKYDLSINRYKEIVYEEVEYEAPQVILNQLEALEQEIMGDLQELRGMLG